ncbi:hypothetical protein [Cupriavidus necator]
MQTVLYPYHAMTAGMLSAMFWWLPQPDYWQIMVEHTMRSNVLPYTAGI